MKLTNTLSLKNDTSFLTLQMFLMKLHLTINTTRYV